VPAACAVFSTALIVLTGAGAISGVLGLYGMIGR